MTGTERPVVIDYTIALIIIYPPHRRHPSGCHRDLSHPLSVVKPVESTQTLEVVVPRVEYRNRLKIASVAISGAYTTPFEGAHGDTDHDRPEVRMVRPCFGADGR